MKEYSKARASSVDGTYITQAKFLVIRSVLNPSI